MIDSIWKNISQDFYALMFRVAIYSIKWNMFVEQNSYLKAYEQLNSILFKIKNDGIFGPLSFRQKT